MKLGIAAAFGDSPLRDIGFLKAYALAAEQTGFNSLWLPEHVVFFAKYDADYPYKKSGETPWGDRVGLYDPLLLAAVAATVTTRLRFGTTVLIVPQRPALLTAKEIMTLDHIAGGRFEFGVGLGWSPEEYAALGVGWESRGQRFDEYLDAIRVAWTAEIAEYHGRFVNFEKVLLRPYPVTPGGPPILVGGNSAAAIRRALRAGDGWYGVFTETSEIRPLLDQLREALAAGGAPRARPFQVKLCMPSALAAPRDAVLRAVEDLRSLDVAEFVLHLPVRSKTLESDMRGWASDLGITGASEPAASSAS